MSQLTADTTAPVQPFPGSFWTANVTELFERAAYYSMASFVVIYLGQLGFGNYWPSFLSSSVLWFLVFFLPILSGTIADQIGFRRALLIAFVLLTVGYSMMGYPVWLGGSELNPTIHNEVTVGTRDAVMIVSAIVLIGIGGSVIKPCISGTVQKVSGARATLGFAIFYMVINIGSLFGRGTAFVVRSGSGVATILEVVAVLGVAAAAIVMLVQRTTKADRSRADIWVATAGFTAIVVASAALVAWIYGSCAAERVGTGASSLSYIFAVAALASVVAFFVVLFTYQEPAVQAGTPAKPKRSVGRILLDMVLVLFKPPVHALPDGDDRLLLHLQPGLQRPAAVREESGRDEPGDGPLHRREPVHHRLLPADHLAHLWPAAPDPLDGRRDGDHRRRDADQHRAHLRGRRTAGSDRELAAHRVGLHHPDRRPDRAR